MSSPACSLSPQWLHGSTQAPQHFQCSRDVHRLRGPHQEQMGNTSYTAVQAGRYRQASYPWRTSPALTCVQSQKLCRKNLWAPWVRGKPPPLSKLKSICAAGHLPPLSKITDISELLLRWTVKSACINGPDCKSPEARV